MIDRKDKYFRLQVGSKQDVVSVDRLKPVFSDSPVSTALPPPRGRPRLKPAPTPSTPSTTPPLSAAKTSKRVRFLLNPQVVPPPIPLRQNPHRSARDRRICSAISPPFLLGGVLWRIWMLSSELLLLEKSKGAFTDQLRLACDIIIRIFLLYRFRI